MKDSYDKKIDGFDRWKLESCLDALVKAEELKKDKKKLKAVQKLASMQLEAAAKKKAQADLETKVDNKLNTTFKNY